MTQEVGIQRASRGSTALNAEHYQTFEIAKANDDVLGGSDIAQIRTYAAYARAQAQAIHKTIAATTGIEDVAAIKAEATETAQTFAKVGIYADQRIGEILRELPKSNKWASSSDTQEVDTKAGAIKDAGISRSQAYDLQAMAANPDVVQAVLDKAEADGRVVSRAQVLKAIDAAKKQAKAQAEQELEDMSGQLEDAMDEIDLATQARENLELTVLSLQSQLEEKEESGVVEVVREVAPSDYEDTKREIAGLRRENERLNREYHAMWDEKRKADERLEQANELLGERERDSGANRDVEQLINNIYTFLQRHGGKARAFGDFDRVDATTQTECMKAVTALGGFAQNLLLLIGGNGMIGDKE